MKVKPQCDLLELWPSVLWTSFNGITLKLVRNTASGDQPIPAASDTLLGGGGVTICISTSMQVGEALHKWENCLRLLGLTREHGQPQRVELRVRVETTETVSQHEFSLFYVPKWREGHTFFTLKIWGLQGTEKQDGSIFGISSHMPSWSPTSLTRCICPSAAQVHLRQPRCHKCGLQSSRFCVPLTRAWRMS